MFRAKHACEKRLRLLFETEDEGSANKNQNCQRVPTQVPATAAHPAQRIGRLPPRAPRGSSAREHRPPAAPSLPPHGTLTSGTSSGKLAEDLVSRDHRPPTSTSMTTSWALLRGPRSSVCVVSFFRLAALSATPSRSALRRGLPSRCHAHTIVVSPAN